MKLRLLHETPYYAVAGMTVYFDRCELIILFRSSLAKGIGCMHLHMHIHPCMHLHMHKVLLSNAPEHSGTNTRSALLSHNLFHTNRVSHFPTVPA